MRFGALLAAALLCANAFGLNVVTWDTNIVGSPVSVYKGELLGISTGESFTLPSLESGTPIICVGQGTFVPVTNVIELTLTNIAWLTNTIWLTNTVTITSSVYTTNTVTTTNYVTSTRTNTITRTNFVTKTNFVTVTNYVGKPPRK